MLGVEERIQFHHTWGDLVETPRFAGLEDARVQRARVGGGEDQLGLVLLV